MLQAQTLPDEAPPIGKILSLPGSAKNVLTFEQLCNLIYFVI